MRRKHFVLVHLLATSALLWQSGCQEQARIETEPEGLEEPEKVLIADPNGPQPKITFETLGHDFGEVPPNKLNKGQIKFSNSGEGVLKIVKVGACCGVKTSLLDKDKTEYAPGESGVVNLEWRSGPHPGPFTRTLVIHSNDKSSPATSLAIKAKVVLRVTWEPKRLNLLLDEENAGCPKVTVRSLDGRPFSIKGFKSTGDCITADFDPTVEATEFVLEPKVNVEKLDKNLKGSVTISLTHPDGNTAALYFSVLPEYSLDPIMFIVFSAEPDKPLIRKLSILNNYEKDFEIESLTSKNGIVGIKLLEQKKIRGGYQLQVEIEPPASEGNTKFMDEFYVVLKGGEKVPIKCNVWYKKTKPVPAAR